MTDSAEDLNSLYGLMSILFDHFVAEDERFISAAEVGMERLLDIAARLERAGKEFSCAHMQECTGEQS